MPILGPDDYNFINNELSRLDDPTPREKARNASLATVIALGGAALACCVGAELLVTTVGLNTVGENIRTYGILLLAVAIAGGIGAATVFSRRRRGN